jgi:hypothetical protein
MSTTVSRPVGLHHAVLLYDSSALDSAGGLG